MEKTYRNWAMAYKKGWLPKESPFVLMDQLPEGTPPLQRPDNSCFPTVKTMEGALKRFCETDATGDRLVENIRRK